MNKILWVDDEVDLLKPHILFLKDEGLRSGDRQQRPRRARHAESEPFSLILLDENMPGLTGAETLSRINQSHPEIPVIMITKSEEENIMTPGNRQPDSRLSDKAREPQRIWFSINKNLNSGRLVAQQTTSGYQQEFRNISMLINDAASRRRLDGGLPPARLRELKLAGADSSMDEMLLMQKRDANSNFCKFVKRSYEKWVTTDEHPLHEPRDLQAARLPGA